MQARLDVMKTIPDLRQFAEVRVAADMAVQEAHQHKDEIKGAINWGDLHVSLVSFNVDEEGRTSWIIEIEEATPDCCKFHEWIRGKMLEVLPSTIEYTIRTEW